MLLVIDTETGGLDVRTRPVLSIGYLVVTDDLARVVRRREIKLKAKLKDCTRRALQINGIVVSRHNVGAMSKSAAVKLMQEDADRYFDGKFRVVGHNAAFDLKFLGRLFRSVGSLLRFSGHIVDTRNLASILRVLGKLDVPNTSLTTLVDHFGIRSRGRAHTALVDAENTLKVLSALNAKLPDCTDDFQAVPAAICAVSIGDRAFACSKVRHGPCEYRG